MNRTKEGLIQRYTWLWMRRVIIKDTRVDCRAACRLTNGLKPEYLLADRGYDTEEIISNVLNIKACPVIPPKKNREKQGFYDKDLYKLRHLVENAFLNLKPW